MVILANVDPAKHAELVAERDKLLATIADLEKQLEEAQKR